MVGVGYGMVEKGMLGVGKDGVGYGMLGLGYCRGRVQYGRDWEW